MKPKGWTLAGALVGVAGLAAGLVITSGGNQAARAAQEPSTKTAKVVEGELTATVSLAGILGYRAQPDGSPYAVVNQSQGTYTKLPELGQVISQGQVLYRVDDSPVVLLYGSTPAYRTLSAGTTGADVAQLNSDLVALGYATSTQLDPAPAAFGPATTTAVDKLQTALGLTPNGTLTLGQAVFEPTALRVTAVSAPPGGAAQAGQTVLQATSTTHQIQVALDASQQTDMAAGDKVSITLPNNQTIPGVVSAVGTVAACPPASGPGGSNTSAGSPGVDSCSSASPQTTTPTIAVEVTPTNPAAMGTWDQAPVRVLITTARVPNALAVPVTALLAQSNGGYSVEIVNPDATHHLIPVSLGLFDDADGLVQVTGAGLAAGQAVVVPNI